LPPEKISDNIINSIPTGATKKPVSINNIISSKNNYEEIGINNNNCSKINTNTPVKNKAEVKQKRELVDVSDNAKVIYDIIFIHSSTADDIVMKTKLPIAKVMQALTELELEEAVERKSGGVYALL